ncbi:HD domain-containing protein [Jeotgalibacillus soli]|uniref:Phosphohydrolase n=1 Tax=Jeotgalibacillus soli TaxID=889306 RepID=A0A0C2V552_9BACL|nr:HD domain-containing protein [Jeotgalibacillus soli]KIL44137.1 phosphohydrolase [Jeotgalibacillus soli]
MNTITPQQLLKAEQFIRPFFERDHSGHDWHHIDRVRRTALFICEKECCNQKTAVELIALLHDVGDPKLHVTPKDGKNALNKVYSHIGLTIDVRKEMNEAIEAVSFKGGNETLLPSQESAIVRDADRLDAIGAIGIARTFAFGGSNGLPLYDPFIQPRQDMTEEEYRLNQSTTIHHFYEKLLKLKDLMVTQTGKELAMERHHFMKIFLNQFFKEWKGLA